MLEAESPWFLPGWGCGQVPRVGAPPALTTRVLLEEVTSTRAGWGCRSQRRSLLTTLGSLPCGGLGGHSAGPQVTVALSSPPGPSSRSVPTASTRGERQVLVEALPPRARGPAVTVQEVFRVAVWALSLPLPSHLNRWLRLHRERFYWRAAVASTATSLPTVCPCHVPVHCMSLSTAAPAPHPVLVPWP